MLREKKPLENHTKLQYRHLEKKNTLVSLVYYINLKEYDIDIVLLHGTGR